MKHHDEQQERENEERGWGGHGPYHSRRGGPRKGRRGPRSEGGRGPRPDGVKRRSGRARRGHVRLALLALLAEEEASGYALMKAVEEKSKGVWRTSPGSVYPTLAQLVDEELIEPTSEGNGRTEYRLTEAGKALVVEQSERIEALWDEVSRDPEGSDALRQSMHKLFDTVRRIRETGSTELAEVAATRTSELNESLQELAQTAFAKDD